MALSLGALLAGAGSARAAYCDTEYDYFDYYKCDCECGWWDPDCQYGRTIVNCAAGQACVYPGTCQMPCAGWTCAANRYGSRDGCDCDCGCWDPDCALPSQVVRGCASGQVCQPPGQCKTLCGGWSCSHLVFDVDDGCHCGCGCVDPDCDELGQPVVGCYEGEGCDERSECVWTCPGWRCGGMTYGDGQVCDCDCGCWDPDCDYPLAPVTGCAPGATCALPDGTCRASGPQLCEGWYCEPEQFAANDGCHCNCGCWDPDCDDPWQSVQHCVSGQYCERPGTCAGGGAAVCAGWTCPPAYYDDGANCDCACGCWDPDCADPALPVYNCLEGQICGPPGLCQAGCQPDCAGRVCGRDPACGVSCGTCPEGQRCTEEGLCETPCVPDCTGLVCGADPLCGQSCGACGVGEHCSAGQCVADCVPDCAGRDCGDDGCGGACGACAEGVTCSPQGLCLPDCVPDCEGRDCGPDGCWGSCGLCAEGLVCDEGRCVEDVPCTPDCASRECGDDGCGEPCGRCAEGLVCSEAGRCVDPAACVPDCESRACGDDGCEGSCGVCDEGLVCDGAGRCVEPGACVAACAGRDCGPDGCGGSCGACGEGFTCTEAGLCVEAAACVPTCPGRSCGDDGCGGSCGQCPVGQTCGYGGSCVSSEPFPEAAGGGGGCAGGGGEAPPASPWLLLAALLVLPFARKRRGC